MANIARLKTWNLNETLTSADLNAEFDNILSGTNNGSLDSDNIDQTDTYTWSGNHTFNSLVTHGANLTVGVNDTGHDVQFFGATSGAHFLWDESADTLKMVGGAKIDAQGTVTVGVDDTGYDVKFFGATIGKYMLWDESEDTLAVVGTAITLNGTAVGTSNVSLTGSTNNTIATVTGADALAGEANLTFDGTDLAIGNAAPSSYIDSVHGLIVGDTGDATSEITIATSTSGTGELNFTDTADTTNQASISHSHSTNALTYDCISGLHEFSFAGSVNARIDQAKLFVFESANANQSIGATLNQATADDEILAFKSSDVAHGMTDLTETDTYGTVDKSSATEGGLQLTGYSEGIIGAWIKGRATSTNATRTTGANAAVRISAALKSGATVGSM